MYSCCICRARLPDGYVPWRRPDGTLLRPIVCANRRCLVQAWFAPIWQVARRVSFGDGARRPADCPEFRTPAGMDAPAVHA